MTGIAFYKLIFAFELVVAEGLLTFKLPKRKYFFLRLLFALLVLFVLVYFFPEVPRDSFYTSLMFIYIFCLTLIALQFTYKIPFKTTLFCAVAGYSAQHLSYELFKMVLTPFDILVSSFLYGSQIINLNNMNSFTLIMILVYFDIYLLIYSVVYFFIGKKTQKERVSIKSWSLLILSALILVIDVVLNSIVIYIKTDYNKIYDFVIGIYNSLCCLLVFFIQRNLVENREIKDELETVSHLLNQSQKQYLIRKEEMDLINVKCHDLKHQISRYGKENQIAQKDLDEIKGMIKIYDANINTGNQVIDLILTEKNLVCCTKNIQFTCMADCEKLNFISDGELYALFGNILDNAINAVSDIEEQDKRFISLNIRRVGEFYSLVQENFYTGDIRFDQNGLPITKNEDKNYHGFGIKSIKMIIDKYNGNLSIGTNNDIFKIEILIPATIK